MATYWGQQLPDPPAAVPPPAPPEPEPTFTLSGDRPTAELFAPDYASGRQYEQPETD